MDIHNGPQNVKETEESTVREVSISGLDGPIPFHSTLSPATLISAATSRSGTSPKIDSGVGMTYSDKTR